MNEKKGNIATVFLIDFYFLDAFFQRYTFLSISFYPYLILKVKYCKPHNSLINGVYVVLLKGLVVRTIL